MKVFLPILAIVATLSGTLAQSNQGSNGLNLLDELTWRVASKSDDHITYVRRTPDQEVDLKKLLNIDCNDTTTTPQPQTSSAPLALNAQSRASQRSRGNAWRSQSQAQRGENLQLRSGDAEGLRRRGSSTSSSVAGGDSFSASRTSGGSSTRGQTSSHTYEGEGDAWWIVTHRTDDHITYTRKNATLSGSQQGSGTARQGQDQDGLQQGKLTKIGSGSDSVLVRVVDQNEELTEEGLLAGRGQRQNVRSGATGGSRGGYPTSELVHPYVKKTNKTLKALRSGSAAGGSSGSRREGLRSLSSGARGGRRGGLRAGESPAALTETTSTTTGPKEDDHPPRVGDELNGWRVVAKTKESISWERIGSTSSSSSSQTSSTSAGSRAGAGLELRSLDGLSGTGSSSSTRSRGANVRSRADRLRAEQQESSAWEASNAQRQLIPSAEGELVEGFPRVFNTYSRSLFGNESDIESVGTIRTSLTNSTNWNVGDELAGWRVIGKDYRGIIWEKIANKTATFNGGLDGANGAGDLEFDENDEDYILNEEDLLGEFNKALKSGQGGDLEDSDEEGDALTYKVPPGTWYLAKETKNKVTWKRDGVPESVVFDAEAYPRVGDVDSVGQWKVESKSKEQITWVRINSLKDE